MKKKTNQRKKSSVYGFNSTTEKTEERISEPEDRIIEIGNLNSIENRPEKEKPKTTEPW